MSKCEMVRKYRNMITFQAQCFNEKNWEDYDMAEDVIRKLEKDITKGECSN